jgi:signal transduction histidine kinase
MPNWRKTVQLSNALILILVGGGVMAVGITRVPLWQILGVTSPMVFNSALCTAILGAAFLCLLRGQPVWIRISRFLGGAVTVFCALVFSEAAFNRDLHIDWPSLHAWPIDDVYLAGQMAPSAVFAFLIVGVSFTLQFAGALLMRVRYALGAIVLATALLQLIMKSLIVELPDSLLIAQVKNGTPLPLMSTLTAVLIALCGIGLLLNESIASSAQKLHDFDRGILGFLGAAFAVLSIMATVAYGSINELKARLSWMDRGYQIRVVTEKLLGDYGRTRAGWDGYLTHADSADSLFLEKISTNVEQDVKRALQLSVDTEQRKRLLNVQMLLRRDFQIMRADIDHWQQFGPIDDAAKWRIQREALLRSQEIVELITTFRDKEGASLTERQRSSQAIIRITDRIFLTCNGVAFAILAAACVALLYSQQQRGRLEQRLRSANENLEARIARRTRDLISANAKLESLNSTLEQRVTERTADLEDFSYSVSHDLRAPLRAIDGYSLMLQEDHENHLSDEGKRLIDKIRGNVQRMGVLIDDLLRLSRLGRQSLTQGRLDMARMVTEVWDEVLRNERDALNACEPDLQLLALPGTHGDKGLVRQVWVNLLSNAFKYSSRIENPLVVVEGRIEGADVIYSVRDNGAGFDMAHAGKLFGVFQRLHRHEEFPGTGVGLAIVQRIVRRHGGRVWAESAVNQGATFYFSLPHAGDLA